MKISSTLEQGIFVVIMLALEEGHAPVKSRVMSEALGVSDSYLKKILAKLSRGGVVVSSASKQGGYQLARGVEKITLADIYLALETQDHTFVSSHYARMLFDHEDHIRASEQLIEKTINQGLDAFHDSLAQVRVSDLLEDGAWQNGTIRWEERTGA